MKNPIVQILDDCGTKPAEFAREYDFTRQAIDYYVNGVYPSLSDKLLDSLYDLAVDNGVEWPDVEALYDQWRSAERANWYERHAQRPRPVWDHGTSPFDTLIKDTSGNRSRFAKDLKVPVRDITRYARGEATTMPMELQKAFDDIKYPWKAELIAMQYNWCTEYM